MKKLFLLIFIAILTQFYVPGVTEARKKQSSPKIPEVPEPFYDSCIPPTPEKEEVYVFASSYYMPAIQRIVDEAPICLVLEDDRQLYFTLKNLIATTPSISVMYLASQKEVKSFINKNEGKLTRAYANPTTIDLLLDIWRKNPCSHAGAGALLQIGELIRFPPTRNMGPWWTKDLLSFCNFFVMSYPDFWETRVMENRYQDMYNPDRSLDPERWRNMDEARKFLEVFDDQNLTTDKYYRLFDSRFEYYNFELMNLYRFYFDRCEELGEMDVLRTGKLSEQALEMYEQHYRWRMRDKKRGILYYEWDNLPKCYELVKKYAPERFHGGPVLGPNIYQVGCPPNQYHCLPPIGE